MGAGKTTVGRLVADRLGIELFDSDEWIERVRGVDGRTIARTEGIEALHDLESEALAAVLDGQDDVLIAPAASVVDRPHLRTRLATETVAVHLDLPLDVERERTEGPDHRRDMDPEEMEATRERRDPLFRQVAVATLDATRSPEALATDIVSVIRSR